MLVLVPIMFIATITMTIFMLTAMSGQELDHTNTIASDFAMVHDWRADFAVRDSVLDGEIPDYPGYPFDPFYDYYTEVHVTPDYTAIVTWPDPGTGAFPLSVSPSSGLIPGVTSVLERGDIIDNFISYGAGAGGRVAAFDLVGMDSQPPDGTPAILRIIPKD